MFSRGELIARYQELERRAVELRPKVDQTLLAYAGRSGYLYESRIKTRTSYIEKLQTGRFSSTDVEDILACTLVVPTTSDVERCIRELPPAIVVASQRGPSSRQKDPAVFRFDEWQLTCTLATSSSTAPPPLQFELQVKTVTIHAWGRATHALVYKGDEFDWRRERLSAQLRALAEQADLLYDEFLRISRRVPRSRSKQTDDLQAAALALKSWIEDGLVPKEHRPDSAVRFAQSVLALSRSTDVSVAQILTATQKWLESNGHPLSVSTFQVLLGVASGLVSDWRRVRQFRCLITEDLEHVFPGVRSVPDSLLSSCTSGSASDCSDGMDRTVGTVRLWRARRVCRPATGSCWSVSPSRCASATA